MSLKRLYKLHEGPGGDRQISQANAAKEFPDAIEHMDKEVPGDAISLLVNSGGKLLANSRGNGWYQWCPEDTFGNLPPSWVKARNSPAKDRGRERGSSVVYIIVDLEQLDGDLDEIRAFHQQAIRDSINVKFDEYGSALISGQSPHVIALLRRFGFERQAGQLEADTLGFSSLHPKSRARFKKLEYDADEMDPAHPHYYG